MPPSKPAEQWKWKRGRNKPLQSDGSIRDLVRAQPSQWQILVDLDDLMIATYLPWAIAEEPDLFFAWKEQP